MPGSNFPEYAHRIINTIRALLAGGQAVHLDQAIDQRSELRGFIGGVLHFEDGGELHFREFVDLSLPEPRLMYAYHYQDAGGSLVFRYDNAAHKPALPQLEQAYPSGVEASVAPDFEGVIDEILGRQNQ